MRGEISAQFGDQLYIWQTECVCGRSTFDGVCKRKCAFKDKRPTERVTAYRDTWKADRLALESVDIVLMSEFYILLLFAVHISFVTPKVN